MYWWQERAVITIFAVVDLSFSEDLHSRFHWLPLYTYIFIETSSLTILLRQFMVIIFFNRRFNFLLSSAIAMEARFSSPLVATVNVYTIVAHKSLSSLQLTCRMRQMAFHQTHYQKMHNLSSVTQCDFHKTSQSVLKNILSKTKLLCR